MDLRAKKAPQQEYLLKQSFNISSIGSPSGVWIFEKLVLKYPTAELKSR